MDFGQPATPRPTARPGAPIHAQAAEEGEPDAAEGRPVKGCEQMYRLAQRYPELTAFTPDATLTEIKTLYGLDSFGAVRALAARRQRGR